MDVIRLQTRLSQRSSEGMGYIVSDREKKPTSAGQHKGAPGAAVAVGRRAVGDVGCVLHGYLVASRCSRM